MKCQIPSSIVLTNAKRNKKNAETTLLCATNLEKLIIETRGEAKKKLALVTDSYAICELFRTLKATMIFFQNINTTIHTQKKFIKKQSTTYVMSK